MKKCCVLILGVLLCAACGQRVISNVDEQSQESVASCRMDFPKDSLQGCWGTHPETGNSILCFMENDSVFWVDPSLWCTYSIEDGTITMLQDTSVYFRGQIEYRNDTLFLRDSDFVWEYERYKE
jgi:hypothetical protein